MPAPFGFPPSFNKVPVHGQYVDMAGLPAQGSVVFTPAVTVIVAGHEKTIVIGKALSVQLAPTTVPVYDENTGAQIGTLTVGAIDIELPATDDPDVNPTNFTYQVEEKFVGLTGRKYSIEVPLSALDIGGVDLSSAAPAVASPGSPLPFILDQLADVVSAGAATGSTLIRGSDGFWRAGHETAAAVGAETVGSDLWLRNNAANLDALVFGAITRNADGAATTAPVVWPDGKPGTYLALVLSTAFPGAVDSYQVTYGSPVSKTVTQPNVTRNASGAVTARPAMTVA